MVSIECWLWLEGGGGVRSMHSHCALLPSTTQESLPPLQLQWLSHSVVSVVPSAEAGSPIITGVWRMTTMERRRKWPTGRKSSSLISCTEQLYESAFAPHLMLIHTPARAKACGYRTYFLPRHSRIWQRHWLVTRWWIVYPAAAYVLCRTVVCSVPHHNHGYVRGFDLPECICSKSWPSG